MALGLTVAAKDQYSTTATGYVERCSSRSTDGLAQVPSDDTFVAGDSGNHAFSNSITLDTAGEQTVTSTGATTFTVTNGTCTGGQLHMQVVVGS